jgi:hypothetical protein
VRLGGNGVKEYTEEKRIPASSVIKEFNYGCIGGGS